MKLKVSYFILILILFSIPLYAQDTAAEETPAVSSDQATDADEAAAEPDPEAGLTINDTDGDNTNTQLEEAPSAFWGIVKAIVVFLTVLGSIFLIYYFMKKSGNKKFHNQQLIKVISSQAITSNKSLHVVEVGREVFLVGAADNAVSLISRIEDKETIDSLHIEVTGNEPVHKNSFRDILSSIFNKGSDSARTGKGDDAAQFIKKQGDRLKNL